MLSPRRMLAVGLVEIFCGIVVCLAGAAVAVWVFSSPVDSSPSPDDISSMMSAMERAQQISKVFDYISYPVIALGIVTALVGAVRWLWADGSQASVKPSAVSRDVRMESH